MERPGAANDSMEADEVRLAVCAGFSGPAGFPLQLPAGRAGVQRGGVQQRGLHRHGGIDFADLLERLEPFAAAVAATTQSGQ